MVSALVAEEIHVMSLTLNSEGKHLMNAAVRELNRMPKWLLGLHLSDAYSSEELWDAGHSECHRCFMTSSRHFYAFTLPLDFRLERNLSLSSAGA